MRRADRLFQIVQALRRKRFMTAAQLAERFEVSERTIYRDVRDLQLSGTHILGEAGVGYQLDETSTDLPPLMFDVDEVEALVLGARMVESWGDAVLRTSARSILDKVDAILPARERERLEKTALFSLNFAPEQAGQKHLSALRTAINECRVVSFAYATAEGKRSRRRVRPMALYFMGRTWMLASYCELRTDYRNFRLDRIQRLRVLDTHFELVPPVTLELYIKAMNAS